MYKLQLKKGLSYTGYGLKATAMRPFVEVNEKATADKLVSGGRFVLIGMSESPLSNVPSKETHETPQNIPLDKMTEKQLDAYAAENGIDLSGISKKSDKLAKITGALDESGELDFGENE